MAKTKNKPTTCTPPTTTTTMMMIKKYLNYQYINKLIFDPHYIAPVCWLLLIGEVFLNIFIIENVNYTEIDWIAYMQEVEGFVNGTFDYQYLKGDTGPCVYPAGFLYIYTLLYYVTYYGSNIRIAQYIFLAIYLMQTYLTYEIYKKTSKIPSYALVLSAITSYRIHSIYVLRLFNDPIAVLLFYASLNEFLKNRWRLGSVFFSLAVSIKMNILLYAPCLLIAYLMNLSYGEVACNLAICAMIQLVLGLPFLVANFWSYMHASFDLGRIFEHKWTVNYRFLDRAIFEDRKFHLALLILHVILLLVFLPALKRYIKSYATLRAAICDMKSQTNEQNTVKQTQRKPKKKQKQHQQQQQPVEEELSKEQQEFLDSFEKQLSKGANNTTKQRTSNKSQHAKKTAPPPPPQQQVDNDAEDKYEINFNKISQLLVLPFFVTNLLGVACARSLHYQFYSWYFHSLLYLAYSTPYKKPVAFLILAVIEYCWNVYPSTILSSSLLHIAHAVLIYGVYKTMNSR